MIEPLPRWEHFPHGADMGIRGFGATPEVAFAQPALALTAVLTDLRRVEPRETVTLECTGSSLEDLFFAWVDAIVFEMSARQRVFSQVEVHIERGRLRATLRGERLDRARHEPAVEVKGPTFTELHVARAPDGAWRAQCVVDV